jgi:NAD(P)-dependent dehydrogenase (short-subunit alcohol dehydrogenase family)
MKSLRDRVAVVTGGASGIGLATARRLASDGAKLVLADIEPKALEPACDALRGEGARVHGVVTDVSDPASVDALAKTALDHFGGVHVVMNNAGVGTAGALWERPLSEIEWTVDVNLWGVIHGIRAFMPILLEQNEPAHVVNVASMAGLTTAPYLDIYTATKHAVVALSESLYKEMQMLGAPIGVTAIATARTRPAIRSSPSTPKADASCSRCSRRARPAAGIRASSATPSPTRSATIASM